MGEQSTQARVFAQCHPDAGTWTVVDSERLAAIISCRKCDAHVVTLALVWAPSASSATMQRPSDA